MVSSKRTRETFIDNLFSFLREYAFDGVDFDWEYPGADDRGGVDTDGANFVTFLKELDDANKKQPVKYVVSFTAPTSYWYLRHFDLKAVDHVDLSTSCPTTCTASGTARTPSASTSTLTPTSPR
jgi:chitinase